MAGTTTTLQNQKEERLFVPGPLTRQEIESLRAEGKAAQERFQELYQMKYGKSHKPLYKPQDIKVAEIDN